MSKQITRFYNFCKFRIDSETMTLSLSGQVLRLRPLPTQVLLLLVRHAGELVTRDALYQEFWPSNGISADQNLNTCIRQIRRALADTAVNPRFLETWPQRGYRFIADVTPLSGALDSIGKSSANRRYRWPEVRPVASGLAAGAALFLAFLGSATLVRDQVETIGAVPSVSRTWVATVHVHDFDTNCPNYETARFERGLSREIFASFASLPDSEIAVLGGPLARGERYTDDPEFVFETFIRYEGDDARALFTLTRSRDGRMVWSKSVDFKVSDALAVQRCISTEINRSLLDSMDRIFGPADSQNATSV